MSRHSLENQPAPSAGPPNVCAWCGSRIRDDQEVSGVGAKGRPGGGLERHAGDIIDILLVTVGKTVPMIVVKPGSPAARDGFDFYFMTCGAGCATALKGALEQDARFGNRTRRMGEFRESKTQQPPDRNQAFDLATQWMNDVCAHVAAWEAADPTDSLRNAAHTLTKRILESCNGASALAKAGQCEQAGALLRVAIENLWLIDLFGSEHPQAEKTLKDWIAGKRLRPVSVRRMLAEEVGEFDVVEGRQHGEFLDGVYGELCGFIHPRAASPSISSLERGFLVVLTSVFGCLPVFLWKLQVEIPGALIHRGYTLGAIVPVLLTAHLPDQLRQEAVSFAAAMIGAAAEDAFQED